MSEAGSDDSAAISGGIISELLEVSIHQILYSRKLYPLAAFHRRKKYNMVVQVTKTFLKFSFIFELK